MSLFQKKNSCLILEKREAEALAANRHQKLILCKSRVSLDEKKEKGFPFN